MGDLPGFDDPTTDTEENYQEQVKKKASKKGGGFQSMGLSFNILKGITKRGYKLPTPIQRKAIPLALEGRDVVAMARTGSGKTACFLIPLFEKLKIRSAKSGARGLILSPTRELAIQTLKFIKELGRFTDLKAAVVLGGDAMENQFAAIHGNPDIIVATPGRFVHVCVEMDLKLSSVEFVVFDEADRLFEMGFGEQLNEIVARLPDSRQTLLFSATLPKILVDFAKAGLSDPVLIRLDVESKLPEGLQLQFITVRPEERIAAVLVLLKTFIDAEQQTVLFAPTKHHVEYLHAILDSCGISNTYIYSDLDPSARKINAAKFGQGKVKVLVVTDVAARGLDIPQLDNVINFNFPAKSKLFVHRVGRCARAGRSGTAYSLATPDEYPYLLDLHLFLGQPLSIVSPGSSEGNVGRIPQSLIEEQFSSLMLLHEQQAELMSMRKLTENANKNYVRCRELSSADSCRRVKELSLDNCSILPVFKTDEDCENTENFLTRMKAYRPQGTIFEICGKNKSVDYQTMKTKRAVHKNAIQSFRARNREKNNAEKVTGHSLPESKSEDIEEVFHEVVLPKKRKIDDLYRKKTKKDQEHFIPYSAPDKHSEEGLAVNSFVREANEAQLDLMNIQDGKPMKNKKVWDRKKKKMVTLSAEGKDKKIRTESGVWIPASFKTNKYAEWKEKTKIMEENQDDDEEEAEERKPIVPRYTHWARHNEKIKLKQRQNEMKSKDQILKMRKIKEKKKARQNKKLRRKKH